MPGTRLIPKLVIGLKNDLESKAKEDEIDELIENGEGVVF